MSQASEKNWFLHEMKRIFYRVSGGNIWLFRSVASFYKESSGDSGAEKTAMLWKVTGSGPLSS